MRLVNPSRTAALLRESGFRFSRDLGQNFLVDPNTLDKILAAAALEPDDSVLEIGTGIGTLTVELAARVAHVVTVEVDTRLDPLLEQTVGPLSNIKRLTMDAMKLTAEDVRVEDRMPNKLVANLPYGIAAPVVLRAFERFGEITSMVVMVQREISDRVMARPGTGDYSAFTAKLAYYCQAQRIMNVSRHVFMPPPNVNSAVVRLTRLDRPASVDRAKLFVLITAGFSQRRKRLANAIGSGSIGFTKEAAEAALDAAGIPANARAENLDLEDFEKLAAELEKY